MYTTTLRPGYLVSLKSSITGNVTYKKVDIAAEEVDETGAARAEWNTVKTTVDKAEHEAATKIRGRARSMIESNCIHTSGFGLLCPDANAERLEEAVEAAQRLCAAFNAAAKTTRVGVYVMRGRVEPNDAQAVRGMNAEIRSLLATMEEGLQKMDVQAVRDAANKARQVSAMLSPEAAKTVQQSVEQVRALTRKIVKAGNVAALEMDNATMRNLERARRQFLDMSEEQEIEMPTAQGRAIDFEADDIVEQVERASGVRASKASEFSDLARDIVARRRAAA